MVETLTGTNREVFINDGTYYVGVTAINAAGETLATNNGASFTVSLPPTDQLIFVTAQSYSINTSGAYPPAPSSFGSAGAADYHCTSIAAVSGLLSEPWDGQKLYFRALVTQGAIGLIGRAGIVNDTYYNTSGNVVATDRTTLLAGNWAAPVLTQTKVQLTGTVAVWTGANPDASASASNCINWTTNSNSATARAGNLNGAGTNKFSQAAITCQTIAHLYCVGDRPP